MNQISKKINKIRKRLIGVSILVAQIILLAGTLLGSGAPFINSRVSAQTNVPETQLYMSGFVKLEFVADNKIRVNIPTTLATKDAGGNRVELHNMPGVKGKAGDGIYTDDDPTDGNHEWTSQVEACGGGRAWVDYQETGQSKITESNGKYRLTIMVDFMAGDRGSGCERKWDDLPLEGDRSVRDQGYWIDRSRVKYKNVVYKAVDCDIYHPKAFRINEALNKSSSFSIYHTESLKGQSLMYLDGDGANNRLIANIAVSDGLMSVNTSGLKFIDINVVEDGYKNSATAGYKLDEDTVMLPCGLKVDNGAVKTVENALYKRLPDTDPEIQGNPDRKGKFFRVQDNKKEFQDWVEIKNGEDAVVVTQGGQGTNKEIAIKIANNGNPTDPPAEYGTKADLINKANTGNNPTPGSTGSTATNLNCEVQLLNPLTWIACPLIEAAQEAVESFDNAITAKLTIDTTDYMDIGAGKNKANGFYAAWASVRTISLSLLVIAGMVMVISQAIGIGIFEAYTVKKILPRIMVAIILTALSWQLMKLAIDLSNAAGYGVRYLIYQPFVGNFEESKVGAMLASLLGFGAVGSLVGLTMLGMLSFALTALMAVIIGFGLIVFREMLIMMLVIFAPFAIACYILPNTQKGWKIWWDFFSKALLVFPIISGMIAIGRVFSMLAMDTAGGTVTPGLMEQTVGFIAYFGPYFLLPAAFRMAGGAIATISGAVNDKSRGGFDRLKKYRQHKMAESGQKMGNYQRYRDSNRFGRTANKALGALANPRDAMRGRAGIRDGVNAGRNNQGAETYGKDPAVAANQKDSKFHFAVASRKLAEQKRAAALAKQAENERLRDAAARSATGTVADASGNQRSAKYFQDKATNQALEARSWDNALGQAARVKDRNSSSTKFAAAQALAATGFDYDGHQDLSAIMQDIAGNDGEAYGSGMDALQAAAHGAGRWDVGGLNHGAGPDVKGSFRKPNNYTRSQGKTETYHAGAGAFLGAGTVGADGKTLGVADMAQSIAARVSSGDPEAMGDMADYHAMLIRDKESATDANKIEIQKQIDAIESVASAAMVGSALAGAAGGGPVTGPEVDFAQRINRNKQEVRRAAIDPSELTSP